MRPFGTLHTNSMRILEKSSKNGLVGIWSPDHREEELILVPGQSSYNVKNSIFQMRPQPVIYSALYPNTM